MKIGIIGSGKVGISIGYVMRKRGLDIIGASDIRKAQLNVARRYLGNDCIYTTDNSEIVKSSDIIGITTQDGEIKKVAKEIFKGFKTVKNKLFFHTSGAHPSSILSPLEKKGAILGSLHPLQTFPDIDSAINVLPSTYIFIEGDKKALKRLEFLGTHIGYKVVTIEGKNKVLYHLSAVFVCNLLCALLYAGEGIMDRIGIELEPFFPIINATLKNIETKGPFMSLTGPVIRGDVGTIIDHIQAMGNMKLQKRIYKGLSLAALDLVKKRKILNKEVLELLKNVLEEI